MSDSQTTVLTAADKLNLGCGCDYRSGFHNVDVRGTVDPDEVVGLNAHPWSWGDDRFEHVLASNVLEHLDDQPGALDEDVAGLVVEYIAVNRVDRTDSNDRRPLFTTVKGRNARVSTSSVRREVYIMTQPCRWGECPHGRDTETCEALDHGLEARCPSSRSPHPIRSGAITAMRDDGWPPEVVAERVNATPEVIRAHYDHPDPIRRMQSRRQYLDGGDAE